MSQAGYCASALAYAYNTHGYRRQGISLPLLAAHAVLRSMEYLHMRILARNGMEKMSIMLQLVVVLMTSCVGKDVLKNPCLTTLRSATCVDKSGNAIPQRTPPRNATCTSKSGSAIPCLRHPGALHAQARAEAKTPGTTLRNATCVGKGGSAIPRLRHLARVRGSRCRK